MAYYFALQGAAMYQYAYRDRGHVVWKGSYSTRIGSYHHQTHQLMRLGRRHKIIPSPPYGCENIKKIVIL
eukprot:scaffold4420_cov187-Amphora_coffeaeformis.AAC.8